MSAPAHTKLEELGLSPTCIEVVRHLWDYLDEELTPVGADRLAAHLATCPQCRGYEGYQHCFLEAVARLKANFDAPADLREKLAAKLKREGCGCWERARQNRGITASE
ncbi:MAG TPA: zf-HC2 domain-containing protein [Gemmatimonadaceae bacterium]